jgi:hypothetical protein
MPEQRRSPGLAGLVTGREGFRLALPGASHDLHVMWDEPYLESCCRSALHRLVLAGDSGRPPEPKDQPCLERLEGMKLATLRPDGRYVTTGSGQARHGSEILSARRLKAVST